MKKLFMCLLVTFSSDPAALRVCELLLFNAPACMLHTCLLQILSECMVLLGLFSYVIPNDKAGPEWTAAQFEELQLLVGIIIRTFSTTVIQSPFM